MNANADVVHQAYRAFASGDIPALLDLVDDEVAWSAPETLPQGGVFTVRNGKITRFREYVDLDGPLGQP